MFRRIILATDGSKDALRAAEICRGLLEQNTEAELLVLHAQMSVTGLAAADLGHAPINMAAINDALAGAAKHSIDATLRVLGEHGNRVSQHIEHGDAARVVTEKAKELSADLVVVGSRGLSGVASLLMGSVSTKIVQMAPCSVLVARH